MKNKELYSLMKILFSWEIKKQETIERSKKVKIEKTELNLEW